MSEEINNTPIEETESVENTEEVNQNDTKLTDEELKQIIHNGGFNNGLNMEAFEKLMNQPGPDTKALLDRVSNIIEIQDGNIQRAYTKIGNLENQITALRVHLNLIILLLLLLSLVAIVAIILG